MTIAELCAKHGFTIVLVGAGVDMDSAEMVELGRMANVTVVRAVDPQHFETQHRVGKRSAATGKGPRKRWGQL